MKHFVDVAKIEVKSGDGGAGLVSFRREKYVPKGGPDGGNGGMGGSVFLKVDPQLTTLYDFTHKHKFYAEDGESGGAANRSGKGGEDLFLHVPPGTVVYKIDEEDQPTAKLEKIADLSGSLTEIRLAKGGLGGRGNAMFKSSTNQAPKYAQPGVPGEKFMVVFELKMIADIGLIGMPNAGKSTLLAALTSARPKIAEYPFTTLSPNLGVMVYHEQKIVLADIPGLIEGASEGKGLGDDFLRHVERTRVLVHLIDPTYQDPIVAYSTIRKELAAYSAKLMAKPELVVITKLDITEVKNDFSAINKRFKSELKLDVLGISAATGYGFDELKARIVGQLDSLKKEIDAQAVVEYDQNPVLTIDDLRHFK